MITKQMRRRGPISEITEAFKQQADAARRRLLIAALGWDPEPVGDAPNCYAATTGELLAWLRETQPELAAQISETHSRVLRPYYEARIIGRFRH